MRKNLALWMVLAAVLCLSGSAWADNATPAAQPTDFASFLASTTIPGTGTPAPLFVDTCVFQTNDCHSCAGGKVQDCDFYSCTRPNGSHYTLITNCTSCANFC
jgi:hypothetical protein